MCVRVYCLCVLHAVKGVHALWYLPVMYGRPLLAPISYYDVIIEITSMHSLHNSSIDCSQDPSRQVMMYKNEYKNGSEKVVGYWLH